MSGTTERIWQLPPFDGVTIFVGAEGDVLLSQTGWDELENVIVVAPEFVPRLIKCLAQAAAAAGADRLEGAP